jgi:hypothetical protein
VKLKGWGLTQIHEKFDEAQTLKLEMRENLRKL